MRFQKLNINYVEFFHFTKAILHSVCQQNVHYLKLDNSKFDTDNKTKIFIKKNKDFLKKSMHYILQLLTDIYPCIKLTF